MRFDLLLLNCWHLGVIEFRKHRVADQQKNKQGIFRGYSRLFSLVEVGFRSAMEASWIKLSTTIPKHYV
jgi:hypothetical protein